MDYDRACCTASEPLCNAGEDVGHYGGSYKVSYDLHKKYGDLRLLDTPICGTRACANQPTTQPTAQAHDSLHTQEKQARSCLLKSPHITKLV